MMILPRSISNCNSIIPTATLDQVVELRRQLYADKSLSEAEREHLDGLLNDREEELRRAKEAKRLRKAPSIVPERPADHSQQKLADIVRANPLTSSAEAAIRLQVWRIALAGDPDVGAAGLRVAAVLEPFFNRKEWRTYVEQARPVALSGLSLSTIKRGTAELRRRGYALVEIRMKGKDKRDTNHVYPCIPPHAGARARAAMELLPLRTEVQWRAANRALTVMLRFGGAVPCTPNLAPGWGQHMVYKPLTEPLSLRVSSVRHDSGKVSGEKKEGSGSGEGRDSVDLRQSSDAELADRPSPTKPTFDPQDVGLVREAVVNLRSIHIGGIVGWSRSHGEEISGPEVALILKFAGLPRYTKHLEDDELEAVEARLEKLMEV
jgi:hypothetical protein